MGTKIVVIKLKELVKKAVFVIIGLLIVGLLVYIFIPKGDNKQAIYEPGTYSASIILHNSPVRVDVTVNETEITDIQMTELGETQEVFYPLLAPTAQEVAEEIIDKQSVDIEASVDKSMTTQIIVQAVSSALDKAYINKENSEKNTDGGNGSSEKSISEGENKNESKTENQSQSNVIDE